MVLPTFHPYHPRWPMSSRTFTLREHLQPRQLRSEPCCTDRANTGLPPPHARLRKRVPEPRPLELGSNKMVASVGPVLMFFSRLGFVFVPNLRFGWTGVGAMFGSSHTEPLRRYEVSQTGLFGSWLCWGRNDIQRVPVWTDLLSCFLISISGATAES